MGYEGGGAGGGSGVVSPSRAKYGSTTLLSIPGIVPIDVATFTMSPNRAQYQPFIVDADIAAIDQIVIEVTTAQAGATGRFAIYNANENWQPTSLVVETGSVSLASAAVVPTTIADTPLPAGRYLFWENVSDGGVVLRSVRGTHAKLLGYSDTLSGTAFIGQTYKAQTYGAPPDPGLAWDSVTTGGNSVPADWVTFIRIKTL